MGTIMTILAKTRLHAPGEGFRIFRVSSLGGWGLSRVYGKSLGASRLGIFEFQVLGGLGLKVCDFRIQGFSV